MYGCLLNVRQLPTFQKVKWSRTYSVNKCIGSVKTLVNIYYSTGCKYAKDLSLDQHRSDKLKTREKLEFLKLRLVCCTSEQVWTLSLRRVV